MLGRVLASGPVLKLPRQVLQCFTAPATRFSPSRRSIAAQAASVMADPCSLANPDQASLKSSWIYQGLVKGLGPSAVAVPMHLTSKLSQFYLPAPAFLCIVA